MQVGVRGCEGMEIGGWRRVFRAGLGCVASLFLGWLFVYWKVARGEVFLFNVVYRRC